MNVMRILAALSAAGVVAALWWWYRHPGRWVFAFRTLYRPQRQDLARARRSRSTLASEHRQQEAAARSRLNTAEADQRQRVDRARRRLDTLRTPGPGRPLQRLGGLSLYEHVLSVASVTGQRTLALADIDVTLEAGRNSDSLYLNHSGGRLDRIRYPHPSKTPEGEPQGFDEDAVRDFFVRVRNAIADERDFRAGLADRLARAETELEDAENDTAAQDKARAYLDRVLEQHGRDPRQATVAAEWEAARERWQNLTGHFPPP
ncbi:hypothetical protein [Streptomyces sp. NPDC047097]|uniref:hypothetical protein n=1 Tax=Streptomyces sp. NPDC047097 TaxID=3155260 RepID=UPI003407DB26